MCGGNNQPMPKPLTREEIEAATDNRFENPNSGVSAPSWKPDEVAKEKEEIAAEEAAAKAAAAAARVSSTEVVPRSSGGGKTTIRKKPGGGYTKMKTSTYRKSLRAKARKKK